MKRSLAIASCLLVMLDIGGAFAQSPPALDILGIQLGMPREAAVQLLLSHQPPYSVTNTVSLNVEDLGTSVWHVSLSADKPGVVDQIELDFAPPPSESRVLRIKRGVCYNCSGNISPDAPSIENLVRSLADKLKSPTPTWVVRSLDVGQTTAYVWASDGRFLQDAELKRLSRYPARCIDPPTLDQARTNMGINFRAVLASLEPNFGSSCGTVAQVYWLQERGIITHFELTISDVAGLLAAFSKSAALIEAKKGNQQEQELQRANQNSPKL